MIPVSAALSRWLSREVFLFFTSENHPSGKQRDWKTSCTEAALVLALLFSSFYTLILASSPLPV